MRILKTGFYVFFLWAILDRPYFAASAASEDTLARDQIIALTTQTARDILDRKNPSKKLLQIDPSSFYLEVKKRLREADPEVSEEDLNQKAQQIAAVAAGNFLYLFAIGQGEVQPPLLASEFEKNGEKAHPLTLTLRNFKIRQTIDLKNASEAFDYLASKYPDLALILSEIKIVVIPKIDGGLSESRAQLLNPQLEFESLFEATMPKGKVLFGKPLKRALTFRAPIGINLTGIVTQYFESTIGDPQNIILLGETEFKEFYNSPDLRLRQRMSAWLVHEVRHWIDRRALPEYSEPEFMTKDFQRVENALDSETPPVTDPKLREIYHYYFAWAERRAFREEVQFLKSKGYSFEEATLYITDASADQKIENIPAFLSRFIHECYD